MEEKPVTAFKSPRQLDIPAEAVDVPGEHLHSWGYQETTAQ